MRRVFSLLLRVFGVGAAALALVGAFGHVSAMGEQPSFDRVEVEPGRFLHVLCEEPEGGAGSKPVALYDAGAFGVYTDGWWIKEELKSTLRVCLYDRAGMGWSDPAPARVEPTPDWHVEDMRRLLGAVGAEPPYVLIGHSMAGLRLHAFASRRPEEVAGLVFIDAARPGAMGADEGRRLVRFASAAMNVSVWSARLGLARIAAPLIPDALDLPKPAARDKRRSLAAVRHHVGARREIRAARGIGGEPMEERASDFPVSVFAASDTGGRNAEVAEEAARRTGFGRVHALPEEDHVSLLSKRIAPLIAADVRDMLAHLAAGEPTPASAP